MDDIISVNDILDVKIDDLGVNGEGIAHADNNLTVFVPFALPGERVKARVTYVKKNLIYASLANVYMPSADRVDPICPVFGRCGGCSIMHYDYKKQVEYKRLSLENTLRKAGIGIKSETVVMSPPFYYRNKIQLPFTVVKGIVALGFFAEKSHKAIPIEKCCLHDVWADKLIRITAEYANRAKLSVYNERTGKGLLRHLTARYIDGYLTVALVINGSSVPGIMDFKEAVEKEFPRFSIYLNENRARNNVIYGNKLIPISKCDEQIEVSGIKLTLSPLSFFQVNDYIREKLYQKVIEIIKPDSNVTVIDAYSGAGLLGAVIAKHGGRVYNIDIVKDAIADAAKLYEKNGVGSLGTHIAGDSAVILPELLNKIKAAVKSSSEPQNRIFIVLDPPRKGVSPEVTDALNNLDVKVNLIYISCNPATLARDLALLSDKYKIESVTPFDMFPQTPHIETLVSLCRK